MGYGKTEVALRAAFKTVNGGMQVGLLVPTTVLAQQHYATFSERLSPFPVRVEMLSRFRTRNEQQEVIEGLKLGTVDIVIGTHRLLQKDVKFKNLGLVVVDEEQRFGVVHKELLKHMRRELDDPDPQRHSNTAHPVYGPVGNKGYEHHGDPPGRAPAGEDLRVRIQR